MFMQQHEEAARTLNYALAGTLVTSPAWVGFLQNMNLILTSIGVVIGLVIGIRQLMRDLRKPINPEQK
jgi:hypothetical protein